MADVQQRNALARTITARVLSAPLDVLRALDRLILRIDQLRALSWTRRIATGPGDVDLSYHLVSVVAGSMATRCNGRWFAGDTVETSLEGPPLHEMCAACVERWARGHDRELYGVLDLARDLRTEDIANAALHEAARLEMIGCCPRFVHGDGTHDLDCQRRELPAGDAG